jgi:hypothetical protein
MYPLEPRSRPSVISRSTSASSGRATRARSTTRRACVDRAAPLGKRAAKFIDHSPGQRVVVLVLLGGTTWASDGIWAPDSAYSRFISPIIGLAWIAVISGLLFTRGPSTARAPERPAVSAPQFGAERGASALRSFSLK